MSKLWRTRHVEVAPGVSLALDEWEGDGPRVVMLHATGFSRGVWRPVAERLAGRCSPTAVDLRGHGDSSKPEPPYPWPLLMDDVVSLVKRERWSGIVLCGHSVGGAVAAEVAYRLPERVRALVLVEAALSTRRPAPAEGTPQGNSLVERTIKRRSHWESREQAAAYLRARVPYDSWSEEVYRAWAETAFQEIEGGATLSTPPWAEAATFEGARTSPVFDHLSSIRCPTWVLRGATDRGLPSTTAPEVASVIPDARERIVEGAGHFLPQERPDLVAEALLEALEATKP